MIGLSQFGSYDENFSNPDKVFMTTWIMFVGGVNEDVSVDGDLARMLFLLLFTVFVFFLAFNVIIAIIVESYLKVKKRVEFDKTDYHFLLDVYLSFRGDTLQYWYKWRRKQTLLAALERSARLNVTPSDLLAMLPQRRTSGSSTGEGGWEGGSNAYQSCRTLFRHYNVKRFPFLKPEDNPYKPQNMTLDAAIGSMEERLALILKKNPTTPFQRVKEQHRRRMELEALRMQAFRQGKGLGPAQDGIMIAPDIETGQRAAAGLDAEDPLAVQRNWLEQVTSSIIGWTEEEERKAKTRRSNGRIVSRRI
jgi:hypothetical protein